MATFTVNTHHAYLNNDIVIKANGKVTIEDTVTGQKYEFQDELKIHLSAGKHTLKSGEHEEEIIIEDAIKVGGSNVKNAFVFDNNPWVFITTKDRLYATNKETGVEKVEYNITPDKIMSLPSYDGEDNEYFLFQTQEDYAVYNVLTGKIEFQFTDHIFSNEHLVVFEKGNNVEVFDYRDQKTIVEFDAQYSFGSKLYFVKEEKLYGLDLDSSDIKEIYVPYSGKVKDTDILQDNYLLKLDGDYNNKKSYLYVSLDYGEENKGKSWTGIRSPYYIESWNGETMKSFLKAKEEYDRFEEQCEKVTSSYPNVHSMCLGVRVDSVDCYKKENETMLRLHGEIVSYPKMKFTMPFYVEGCQGETIDLSKYVIEIPKKSEKEQETEEGECIKYSLDNEEKKIGESESGNLLITQVDSQFYLRNIKLNDKKRILSNIFDNSNYQSAYFTGDGKNVFLRINDKEAQLLGLENFSTEPFEVDGFTLAKNEGLNGYVPEFVSCNGQKPVWRDPITLKIIPENDLSNHIFMSPDGKYSAQTQMKTVFYNRFTQSEMSPKEFFELRSKYTPNYGATEEEIKEIIDLRVELIKQYDWKKCLSEKLIKCYECLPEEISSKKSFDEYMEEKVAFYIGSRFHLYDFVSLFVDKLQYVCYKKNEEDAKEEQLLIGRNVFYLNYVSFSYDSRYISFAAKLDSDNFRPSQDGIFEIFDLEKNEIVQRVENVHDHALWAVWMTIFSKKGDVAFYDSRANAYLMHKSDNYNTIEEASGKSLLCFSPSGRYIACSDQNYIDYTHHPNSNWGHQPSGNVFIHSVDKFSECLEQYNDLGDGITGVASRAKSVSSAAFSQDETKLLVVGQDGVVVIRNLKNTALKSDGLVNTNRTDENTVANDYGTHYREYANTYAQNVMGYSDEVINDAFDGEPDACWNID